MNREQIEQLASNFALLVAGRVVQGCFGAVI